MGLTYGRERPRHWDFSWRQPVGSQLAVLEHFVDHPVLDGIGSAQDVVPVGVGGDPIDRLAGVVRQNLLDAAPEEGDLPGLVLDVDRLSLGTAVRLVDQDPGVGQRVALAGRPAGQEDRAPEAAMPRHTVETSGRMICMVS